MGTMQRPSAAIQDFLSDLVRGKDVLDVGCGDHTATLGATDTCITGTFENKRIYEQGSQWKKPKIQASETYRSQRQQRRRR
jgi:hypothetical protein